jgi:ubiquinone/menaquinone biosynthesis C-methylase UbiE
MVVLDVGCGTGAFLACYAAAGCRVAGLDASADMLAAARRRLGPGAILVRGDAVALPFASASAGLVTATMLLHSLSPAGRGAALAEMARVAGPSGWVVVADHRPGRTRGAGARAARGLARGVEAVAGHGPGVRSLLSAGGLAALAGAAGLLVEEVRPAAAGALEVVRLRQAGEVA